MVVVPRAFDARKPSPPPARVAGFSYGRWPRAVRVGIAKQRQPDIVEDGRSK